MHFLIGFPADWGLNRRGGFSRSPRAAAEDMLATGGKSTMVFGGWARGASKLVSKSIVEEKLHEELVDEVEAKRRYSVDTYTAEPFISRCMKREAFEMFRMRA